MNITINLTRNTFKNLFIRLKEWLFGKNETITVVVEKENGVFSHYMLPKKLNKIYRKRYNGQPSIKENIFLGFIIAKLPQKEGIEYFAHVRKEEIKQIAAHSSILTNDHLSSNQEFSILYACYDSGKPVIKIISELNGRLFTKEEVTQFKIDWQNRENKTEIFPKKEELDEWFEVKS